MDNKTQIEEVVAADGKEAGTRDRAQGLRPLPARRRHREEGERLRRRSRRGLGRRQAPSRSPEGVPQAVLGRVARASIKGAPPSIPLRRTDPTNSHAAPALQPHPAEAVGRGADGRGRSSASIPDTVAAPRRGDRRRARHGLELCLVIGGGNIFRGLAGAAKGIDRASADYMGMLATVMNALAMQNALEKIGVDTRVQSAIPMATVCEPYIRRRADAPPGEGPGGDLRRRHRQSLFTTDTAAALRAAEMGCDALFKGTSVDGVYDADPKKNAGREALRSA